MLNDWLGLVLVFILVMINGFFVAAEFSLVSVRKTRIAERVARGDTSAKAIQKAIEDPDRFIAATQLGITLASLGLGWIGEPALSHLIEPLLAWLPGEIAGIAAHIAAASIIAFVLITGMHVDHRRTHAQIDRAATARADGAAGGAPDADGSSNSCGRLSGPSTAPAISCCACWAFDHTGEKRLSAFGRRIEDAGGCQ